MSSQQSNKTKFIVSILAMTSLAAFVPTANAQTVKPNITTENILNRANLKTDSTQRKFRKKASFAVLERLNKPSKIKKKGVIINMGCETHTK